MVVSFGHLWYDKGVIQEKEIMNMKKQMNLKKLLACLLACVLTFCTLGMLTACGGAKFDASKNISVVTREDGSGTKSAFMEIIGLKGKTDVSGVIVAVNTAAAMEEVKSNPLAIAYDSLGYVTDEVKILTVDGVAPSVATIKDGSYKISRPLNVVYQESRVAGEVNTAFLTFLQSSDAQTMITAEGYVSTGESATAYTVVPGLTGEIAISGSTSLKPLMEQLAAKFEELQSGVSITVGGGGSGTGYNDAKNGVSDFGMISETFNVEKADNCTYYEVAKDGIAVIVNKANPMNNVSLADLKNIYDADAGDAAVKTWADIAE